VNALAILLRLARACANHKGPIPIPQRSNAPHAKLQLALAQARENNHKIAQSLLRGGEYIHFRHRSIPLTQTA
jgi:hypothetical protein